MSTSLQIETPKTEYTDYDRVMGCWLGKAVGGTLGMPFEGVGGPLDLEFYEPVPTEMLPNDDLDLQVVWACVLDKLDEIRVDRHLLAKAWQEHVHFPWDEYGVALRNIANGLRPPLTGSHDNWFKDGMGAPIRSEIWACLAPANPALAAAYAYEDACVDHADEGIYGEMFFAALQSMAFAESDTDVLLDNALPTLPEMSLIRRSVEDTREWWKQTRDWREVRELILRDYGHENFTDAPMNVAFTILGWLAGEGDFSRAICIATNCGKDTDCTAATVGALMGIIEPNCIPERWLSPIGRDLVLSPGIVGLNPPATLDAFTDLVLDLRHRLNGKAPEAEIFDQSVDNLKVAASIEFSPAMPSFPLKKGLAFQFDGTSATWPNNQFQQEYMMLNYPIHLPEAGSFVIMLNTPQHCRVWINEQFLFESQGEPMAPSFHRVTPAQQRTLNLPSGNHTLSVAIRRPIDGRDAQWVIGVGDAQSKQWIPTAFVQ